jgi:MYXO-CTERM domain-containing protein
VRFDANRAYAITYNQTDPLFTIDLSNPAAPQQRGELSMPGFMFYLEPYGDRVIGLGVDRTDPNGSLNVSLFDVSNMDSPKMLNRVAFGAASLNEDYAILNYEVPEDQDRIQKAFHVFADGRVAVPFSSASPVYDNGSGCVSPASGVQLVSWQNDTLTKDALLPVLGNPRRALEIGTDILAVSDSNVTEFSLARGAGYGKMEANVVIGTCVAKTLPNGGAGGFGDNGVGVGNGGYDGGYGAGSDRDYYGDYGGSSCGPFANWKNCSVGPIGAASGKPGAMALGLGLALAGVMIRRRRHNNNK